jgi:hypothetical protein
MTPSGLLFRTEPLVESSACSRSWVIPSAYAPELTPGLLLLSEGGADSRT